MDNSLQKWSSAQLQGHQFLIKTSFSITYKPTVQSKKVYKKVNKQFSINFSFSLY